MAANGKMASGSKPDRSSRPRAAIRVHGARQNNLKGLDLEIPHERLTVITGVSGSGKSSLAFQTLYAEGQRRYSESLSAYVRQFLERLPRPEVDAIDGMLPAIAIEQQSGSGGGRSTVATLTDLADYLKLLYARAATLHCPQCHEPVQQASALSLRDQLLAQGAGRRAILALSTRGAHGEDPLRRLATLSRLGYTRRLVLSGASGATSSWDGSSTPLPHPPEVRPLDHSALEHDELWLVLDRLTLEPARGARLLEALEQGLERSARPLLALVELPDGRWQPQRLTTGLRCQGCQQSFEAPTPSLFSYNSPVGACPRCNGFGRVMEIDWDLVIPDPSLSLEQGAIRPWSTPKTGWERNQLRALCSRAKIPMDRPWGQLPQRARQRIIDGHGGHWGLRDWFAWLESRTYKTHVRILLARYRAYTVCPACQGSRLRPEALAFRVGQQRISDIYAMEIGRARRFVARLKLPRGTHQALHAVLAEIRSRLDYLDAVGLGYLTLERQARTLSGGEAQRVTLTSALGAGLVHTLFVLDEPTVGLHPRDTQRLLTILAQLVQQQNTVVVVEHDPDVIRAADHLLDLGPGAGEQGGKLLYAGPPAHLPRGRQAQASATARLLRRPGRVVDRPPPRRATDGAALELRGATAHNLQRLDLRLPLGTLTCVTGVSGSGKSTLVEHVLYRGLLRRQGKAVEPPGAHRELRGWQQLSAVVFVDQSPAAASPRATPLTYVGVFDAIRKLYAATDQAAARGLGPGSFSWNTAGGRCPACEGAGVNRVELHFLPDAMVPCEVCQGRRFGPEVLAVRWNGRNLHQLLQLSVEAALPLFEQQPRIRAGLQLLTQVGLGYLRLGQGLNTLSGGESQRLKLARHLALERQRGALFLLDEPTRGLHLADVSLLVRALHDLVEQGNTAVVVEHHPEVIWQADHVLDLGPEGGAEGGQLVFAGPPPELVRCDASHTGRALARHLEPGRRRTRPRRRRGARPSGAVELRGAQLHNLRGLDLDLPRDRLVVLSGPSGSGKSSLAFDILHAEGQRRFLDCLSPFARQYMKQLSRPEVDSLRGLPPTIAVEQRLTRGRQLSTVATAAEIYPYLRVLLARAGTQLCHGCGQPTSSATPEQVVRQALRAAAGQSARLLAPVIRQRKGWHQSVLQRARKLAVRRGAGQQPGRVHELRVDGAWVDLTGDAPERLQRYRLHDIDVVLARGTVRTRGAGSWRPMLQQALELGRGTCSLVLEQGEELFFGTRRVCHRCRVAHPAPDPRLFSFTTEQGGCPDCGGAGGECRTCNGSRLQRAALQVVLGGATIAELHHMLPAEARRFLSRLKLPAALRPVVQPLRQEILARLELLERVGLGYLQLDRSAASLSGGEVQRLRLAAHLSAPLHGVLYILDEPTIGLHPEDHAGLLAVLRQLKRDGNTVLIVEHDQETMEAADQLVDLGPGGGRQGGQLVDQGSPRQVKQHGRGATARLLRGELQRGAAGRGVDTGAWLELRGARAHNLRQIDVRFPVGALSVITGRSGSGKSTLLRHVLRASAEAGAPVGCAEIRGLDQLQRVAEVDQEPIGRNPLLPGDLHRADDAPAPTLRRATRGPRTRLRPRPLLVQRGGGPLPHLRRPWLAHGGDGLSARRSRALPAVRRPPLPPRHPRRAAAGPQHRRRAADGGSRGAGAVRQRSAPGTQAGAAVRHRPGLPAPGAALTHPQRRRGPAHQAGAGAVPPRPRQRTVPAGRAHHRAARGRRAAADPGAAAAG